MLSTHWSLFSLVIVSASLVIIYLWYDRKAGSTKEIALIATLAAFAGLSRVPFAAIPSLQPTTFLVLISGYVFGAGPGFMVGSLAAFVSNLFLGHGPWTPWQMMAWGLVGLSGGILGRWKWKYANLSLLILSFMWGLFFGWILNIWHWLTFVYPLTLKSFIAVQLTSIWFDLIHASGNVFFMYFLGADLIKILHRFKRRLTVSSLSVQELERS
ncbi:energy-coupling factor transport system substrate-specific component [Anaerovirgula multivorans]|uniref:Energy-coupling factor transport system substrate-specific component n=1 Tax=Anaerovirgula multivorans TaxID=312168 RepID=A0A239C8N5_9FIRM|nr:ECF transporter S component [Anaerovirgula multivorans]SNS16242.1 energy-coupling factor transport system substrate-specific component [Anaerovirgula multivorans]